MVVWRVIRSPCRWLSSRSTSGRREAHLTSLRNDSQISGRARLSPDLVSGAVVTFSIDLDAKPLIGLIRSSTFIMPRLRKSKQPADESVSPPTLSTALVQGLTSRRDPGALAASSTAIALTIGSAFSNTSDTPGDDIAVQERDAGWKTVYAAFKIAVDTIKESSDLCLPLKAVVGAVSVLTKNCDVSAFCLYTENLLIPSLFPAPANIR